ncbi:mitogen-activated protein kinase kinase kinase 1 [Schistosoma japonicum]|nr:mitogen-activated protein kinase kinase kinase 1 [Schistosoma japonicum]
MHRAFRELLGYLVCYNKETQSTLQKTIGPILRRLLRFVGGSSNLWNLRNSESFLPLTYKQNDENKINTNSDSTNNSSHLDTNRSDLMNENNLTKKMNELSIIQTKSKSSLPVPADVNFRDRSNLALATLIELAKGQSGALALGREVQSDIRK